VSYNSTARRFITRFRRAPSSFFPRSSVRKIHGRSAADDTHSATASRLRKSAKRSPWNSGPTTRPVAYFSRREQVAASVVDPTALSPRALPCERSPPLTPQLLAAAPSFHRDPTTTDKARRLRFRVMERGGDDACLISTALNPALLEGASELNTLLQEGGREEAEDAESLTPRRRQLASSRRPPCGRGRRRAARRRAVAGVRGGAERVPAARPAPGRARPLRSGAQAAGRTPRITPWSRRWGGRDWRRCWPRGSRACPREGLCGSSSGTFAGPSSGWLGQGERVPGGACRTIRVDEILLYIAAEDGHLHTLQWVREHGCRWGEWMCASPLGAGTWRF